MKLEYTPVPHKIGPLFEITVAHEHGDSDKLNYHTLKLETASEDELLTVLKYINETSDQINEKRWYDKKLPLNFSYDHDVQYAEGKTLYFALQPDSIYSEPYAAISIKEVRFIDANGVESIVQGW
ncbi:hypothetical protein [Yersinia phage fHe-Yen9-04]|uniref:Uncharacterized protein n=2 Tax=Eneladusvirus Yen904 TaxID=2560849 RepID=A0A2C9CXR2_9CAUD|nr:hypothetical protein FDJ41_gp471 [Yersinia phage fHe-Yen9-04]SOK58709.1 hypothetical protein [Yersinia phage fHe-Yen9-04]SOK59243.1 hypothetical protein [Yersinia phage fHe-Yen9-03]VUE36478.1 hypothetical protein [Yersinia phage fHe-Yen9-04]